MKEQLSDLLGRKMIMFYISFLGIFILTWFGKLSGDNFLLLYGWIVSAFVAGNIGEWKYKTSTLTGITASEQNKINFKRD